jgi:hypothetical protein
VQAGGRATEKQHSDIRSSVKVAHDTVIATREQQVAVYGASGVTVLSAKDARGAAPNQAFAVESMHSMRWRWVSAS